VHVLSITLLPISWSNLMIQSRSESRRNSAIPWLLAVGPYCCIPMKWITKLLGPRELNQAAQQSSIYLVGGIPTPLKNMKVSWEYYSHILWKKNKPPTRYNHQYIIVSPIYQWHPHWKHMPYPSCIHCGFNHIPSLRGSDTHRKLLVKSSFSKWLDPNNHQS